MATFLARATTVADGVTADFTVPFPYLLPEHVFVYLTAADSAQAVLQTVSVDYVFTSSGMIHFTVDPGAGTSVLRQRSSNPGKLLAEFTAPATIGQDQLRLSSTQLFYLQQENQDELNDLSEKLNAALSLLAISDITSLALPTTPQVQTVAALLAIPKAIIPDRVQIVVGGHTNPAKGGGTFVWVAGSTANPNAGTIFASNAGGTGRWFRLFHGMQDVQFFGALADGDTATNAAALQNAMDAGSSVWTPGRDAVHGSGFFGTGSAKLKFNDWQYLMGGGPMATWQGTVTDGPVLGGKSADTGDTRRHGLTTLAMNVVNTSVAAGSMALDLRNTSNTRRMASSFQGGEVTVRGLGTAAGGCYYNWSWGCHHFNGKQARVRGSFTNAWDDISGRFDTYSHATASPATDSDNDDNTDFGMRYENYLAPFAHDIAVGGKATQRIRSMCCRFENGTNAGRALRTNFTTDATLSAQSTLLFSPHIQGLADFDGLEDNGFYTDVLGAEFAKIKGGSRLRFLGRKDVVVTIPALDDVDAAAFGETPAKHAERDVAFDISWKVDGDIVLIGDDDNATPQGLGIISGSTIRSSSTSSFVRVRNFTGANMASHDRTFRCLVFRMDEGL